MIPIILVGALALQGWAWRRLSRRVVTGDLARLRAVARYFAWALLPPLLWVAALLGAVGLEEWLDVAVIGETIGRAALPLAALLLAFAAVGSLCFGVRSVWLKAAAQGEGGRRWS